MAAASPTPARAAGPPILALLRHHERELSGADPATTNNRMELTAAASALEALSRACRVVPAHGQRIRPQRHHPLAPPAGSAATGATPPATRSPTWICGAACWQPPSPHTIEWLWVRGHAGDPMNDRVDALATQARGSGDAAVL